MEYRDGRQVLGDEEFNIIKFLLASMYPLRNDPERNSYCVGFDDVYESRKRLYKQYTGEEWRGER